MFSKKGIFETKLDTFNKFLSLFSIWIIFSSNFELLNFMWWLYDDVANEFVDLFNSYEEQTELYVELSYAYDARPPILRDLDELTLFNPFIILLIVT